MMNPAVRQENAFGNQIWCASPENVSVIQGITKEILVATLVSTPFDLLRQSINLSYISTSILFMHALTYYHLRYYQVLFRLFSKSGQISVLKECQCTKHHVILSNAKIGWYLVTLIYMLMMVSIENISLSCHQYNSPLMQRNFVS